MDEGDRGMGLTPNLIYGPIQDVFFPPPSLVISGSLGGAPQFCSSPYSEGWMHCVCGFSSGKHLYEQQLLFGSAHPHHRFHGCYTDPTKIDRWI